MSFGRNQEARQPVLLSFLVFSIYCCFLEQIVGKGIHPTFRLTFGKARSRNLLKLRLFFRSLRIGAQNLIFSATNLLGSVTNSIWLLIQKASFRSHFKYTSVCKNDGEIAPGLIEIVATKASTRFIIIMLDAGYAQLKVYETAQNVMAQAIIPLNYREEREPPAGMTTNVTLCCSTGFPMTYWGANGDYLMFLQVKWFVRKVWRLVRI